MKNLLESIRNMYQPQSEATMMKDDGKMVHNCAKHVEHAEYGRGNCIAEEHAAPDRNGNIAWYDIVFEHGVERGVPVTELNVLQSESHMHATKKTKKMAEEIGGMPEKPAGGSNAAVSIDPKQAIKKKAMNDAMAAANKPATGPLATAPVTKQGVTKEDVDVVDENWIVHKDGKVIKSGIKQHKTAKAHAEKLGAKVNSAEWYHDNVTSKNKQGMSEDVGAVDEKMQVFHATSPGAQMKRYHKDSPAPEAAAHRNAAAAAAKGLRATGALKRKSFSYGSTNDIKTPKGGTVMAMKRESFEYLYAEAEQVDETIISADREYNIMAEQDYKSHFNAMMKKHGIKHPGEFKSDAEKKAFFNKVDASYQAKNEDVFLEAYMASDLDDVKSAHKKAGNKISDEKSGTKGGQGHHSFVVTTPAGKRTRHIYHGNTKKMESMSAAPRSKEAKETGEDDDDK